MSQLYLQVNKFRTFFANLELKRTAQGNEYFLYQLLNPRFTFEFNQSKLNLHEHHVSVHKKDDLENPFLSAYHYTAYFLCENQRFQLHVYFGRKDEVLAIQFSQQTASRMNHLVLDEETEKKLIELAINKSSLFVRSCRAQANVQLKSDKAELNQRIISVGTATNPQQYRERLTGIIEALTNILAYYPSTLYTSKLRYYKRMYRQIPVALMPKPVQPQVQVSSDDSDVQGFLALDEAPTVKIKQDSPTKAKTQLAPQIAQLKQEFTLYTGDVSAEMIPRVIIFYQQVYAAYVCYDDKDYFATSEDKNELDNLIQAIEEQRLKIFQRLIIFKNFTEARCLVDNEQLDSEELSKFVHFALRTVNHELLDFLLTHYEYPINTSEFDSLSPVMYCLSKCEQIPEIAKCFWVLVKHNASLSEQIPGTSQSIMETILFTPKHPLKPTSDALNSLPSPIAEIEREEQRTRLPKPKTRSIKALRGEIKELKEAIKAAQSAIELLTHVEPSRVAVPHSAANNSASFFAPSTAAAQGPSELQPMSGPSNGS